VAEFFAQATESYDWLVEGFIARGAITKLAGKAKYSGKTTLLMHLVASVLLGTPFLGMPTTQGKVLFLSEQGNNLKVALESAGIDEHTGGLKLLLKRSVFDVSWENLMGLVLSACKEEEIDLAIVDTLVDFSDVEGDEENSSGKVKATMKALKRLKDSGIGVCFTQHHNIHGRGRGSTQFEGEVDIVLDLHRLSDKSDDGPEDSDNTVRLLEGIGRGVEHKLYIRLGDDGYEAMNVTEDRLKIGKNGRLVLRFLPVLKAEAKTIPEVKSALEEATHHMSETTIRRELKKLEDEGLAHKTGEGTKGDPVRFWRSEPKKEETETQEPEGTNLLPPVSHPVVETGDNHFGSEKVTPIRPGIEVSEESPAPKAKEAPAPNKEKKTKGVAAPPSPEELAEAFDCYVHTEERLAECHEWAIKQPSMAIDIETMGKKKDTKDETILYTKAVVRGIGLYSEGKGWFLDCNHLDDEKVASLLRELEGKPKYFHNSPFDVPRIYRRFGVLLNKDVRDTLIASKTARAGEWEMVQKVNDKGNLITTRPKKSHDLEDCIERELSIEIPKIQQKWSGDLTADHMEYVLDDVAYLEELYRKLYERIEDIGVKTVYDTIVDTVHMFLESAALGVPFDIEMLEGLQAEIKKDMDEAERQLKKLSKEHAPNPEGEEWVWGNIRKPDALDKWGNKVGRNGMHRMLQMVGVKLTNLELEPTLLDNRDKHPLVKALYDYKKAASEYSKYRRIPEDFYEDGYIFPQVKPAGAVTSRVLYTDTNIQGFDKKKTDKYRRCVRAEEGCSIVKGDFAQQELRIAAYWSEDPALMTAFANNEDVYMRVAEKIVGKKVKRGTKVGENARAAAKRAVLGYLYGLGPAKYRKNVYKDTGEDISEEIAKRDRQAFRNAFPELYKWQRRYGSHKDETNLPKPDMWETRSVRGWRRVVAGQYEKKSDWKKENNIPADWIPKYTDRLNGPIQSTAGDILYITLIKLDADLRAGMYPGTRFLFTAHDEVVLTCPEDIAKEVAVWLKSKMVEAFEEVLGPKLGGSRSVEVGGGPSWGEIEEWI